MVNLPKLESSKEIIRILPPNWKYPFCFLCSRLNYELLYSKLSPRKSQTAISTQESKFFHLRAKIMISDSLHSTF